MKRIWIAMVMAVGLTVTAGGVASAADLGAVGKKLIIKDASGTDKLVSIQTAAGINPGAAGNAALVSGSLSVSYIDTPSNAGVLNMPPPWAGATAAAFKFKNALAPLGPSQVKVSKVKPSKLAKVVAKGLGGLDISAPPGAGGVLTIFTLNNGNDASQLRLCTRYSVGDGSTITHKVTGSGFKLTLKNGVGAPCPSCSDGLQNQGETGVDCGGPCSPCGGTCSDGLQNQNETGVDCGGPCSTGCSVGGGCNVVTDCLAGLACAGGLCRCPNNLLFTFTVNSNAGGVFDSAEWPGGTSSQSGAPGCSVTINRPNDNVDLVCTLATPFSVNSFSGYSNCFGTGGEDGDGCQPVACPPAGIGSCCNTRPSCSAALNGSAQSAYFVQCLQ